MRLGIEYYMPRRTRRHEKLTSRRGSVRQDGNFHDSIVRRFVVVSI